MNDMSQLIEEERLFEDLCYLSYLRIGFEQVKENKGKPGIDGVTIQDFEFRMEEELSRLQQELLNWTYKPSPVRRVEIPKPGGQGVRLLGIPTVRDRVVQTALKLLLEPIFEPHFSPHSYGFRPGRSQHQAVQAAQSIVNSGKPYVVDSLKSINQWYVGWSNYYSLSNYPSQLMKIEAHIRRRLRARLIHQQKRKKYLYRALVKRGVSRKAAAETVFSNQKSWALSKTRAVTKAYPNSWFINLKGQAIRSDQKREHWFDSSQWVNLA